MCDFSQKFVIFLTTAAVNKRANICCNWKIRDCIKFHDVINQLQSTVNPVVSLPQVPTKKEALGPTSTVGRRPAPWPIGPVGL